MRYFVIATDGKVYGPVDIPTLHVWIKEGRVRHDTELREEEGTVHIRASLIPELQATFSQMPQPASSPYPNPPCRNCGQPFDHSRPVCPNCGMQAFVPEPGRLLTGSATGDRILGFIAGFFSWFLWGFGVIAGLILYAVLRPNYPKFARGVGFGILTVLVIMLGLFALCIVGIGFFSFKR
jgi:hypothetical protein